MFLFVQEFERSKLARILKGDISAVIANTEGKEQHKRESYDAGQPTKHPRATYSSMDDIKCFFRTTRDAIGCNFSTKELKFEIHKGFAEFMKKVDPDLFMYMI